MPASDDCSLFVNSHLNLKQHNNLLEERGGVLLEEAKTEFIMP